MADSSVMIQDGIGRKLGDALNLFKMSASFLPFTNETTIPKSAMEMAILPVMSLAAFLATRVLSRAAQAGIKSYSKAGAIAQESLGNIRTVHMFNLIHCEEYEDMLKQATQAGIKKRLAVGGGTGLMFFMIFCTYACEMNFGAFFVANDRHDGCSESQCYDGGRVILVFMACCTHVSNSMNVVAQRGNSMLTQISIRRGYGLPSSTSELT